VESVPFILGFGPQAQFLCQTAVIRFFPVPEGKSQFICFLFQVPPHLIYVDGQTGKQLVKTQPVFRCIRMQWKCAPANRDLVFFFQSFNTPGNEVAPGSDIVRKYFNCRRDTHSYLLWCRFSYLDVLLRTVMSSQAAPYALPAIEAFTPFSFNRRAAFELFEKRKTIKAVPGVSLTAIYE